MFPQKKGWYYRTGSTIVVKIDQLRGNADTFSLNLLLMFLILQWQYKQN